MTSRMRKLVPTALLGALGTLTLAACGSSNPVGRVAVLCKSPEWKFLDASGNQTLLSSFTGKVVLIEFLLTTCPHCSRVAKTIDKLNSDLGRVASSPLA